MLHEFALEPALLNSWDKFRLYTDGFGFDKGRLIARYPNKWKKLVYEAVAACTEMERKRIEVKLQSVDSKMSPGNRDWNPANDWLLNAERAHATKPFHAIVSTGNPRLRAEVVVGSDLHDSPLWQVPSERRVERSAEKLADALGPILAAARRVIFVDPHFSPTKPKAKNALTAYMKKVILVQGTLSAQVEFHTLHRPEMVNFDADCHRELARRIPTGLQLKIIRWAVRAGGDGFHNRYVFTELGGVRLAWGLDEGQASETDDLTLLDHALYLERMAQFVGPNAAFDFIADFTVKGTG